MGLARLNIFVSGLDDPCRVSNRTWYVTIYNCDGSVLEWCNRRYVVLRAPCGHVQVRVPPGCYYIKAVWSYTVVEPNRIYRANHFTDAAIVTACCEQVSCVKLFNPRAHRCGLIYVQALQDLVRQKAIDPDQAKRAIEAVHGTAEAIGAADKPFELGHLDEIEELVRRQEEEEGTAEQ